MAVFKVGDIAYCPKQKVLVEIQDDGGFAENMCLVKMLSSKKNKNSGFGMVYVRPEELVPSTELASAIYSK
jgi:hypothetical protein